MGIENLGFGGISTRLQSATADLSKLEKLFEGAVGGKKSGHGCGGKGDHGGRGDHGGKGDHGRKGDHGGKCDHGDKGDKGGLSSLLGEIKDELAQLEDTISDLTQFIGGKGDHCGKPGKGDDCGSHGGYGQGGYGGYGQGGFGGYGQGGQGCGHSNQGGWNQGGWSQGGWNQGGWNQGGWNQGGHGGAGQGGWCMPPVWSPPVDCRGDHRPEHRPRPPVDDCRPWKPPVDDCKPGKPPIDCKPPKPPVDCHPKPEPKPPVDCHPKPDPKPDPKPPVDCKPPKPPVDDCKPPKPPVDDCKPGKPPGCDDGHGKKDDLLSFANNGKTGTVKVGDRYELNFDQSNQSVTLKDLCDKSETKVWGDPHVSESNGDKWEFKKDLTFKLEDGTSVTFRTVGGDGKPVTGDTKGPSFVDRVDIVKGHEAASVENIAGQFHHGEGLKMKELDKAPKPDKDTPVIVEKGSDYFLKGKEVDGDTFNKNGETPRA